MKNIFHSIFILTLTLSSDFINAATMEISTRSINTSVDNTDFIASWNDQTSTISSSSISQFDHFYSGNNTISHLSIDLNPVQELSWILDMGLDGHYGAAFYVDNALQANRTDDLWWSYNWSHPDVFSVTINPLSVAAHALDIYWAESCCNGYNSARFSTDGGNNWQMLSVSNLAAYENNVPEPMTITLFFIGLTGVIMNFRKQKVS